MVCKKCGKRIKKGEQFCSVCGYYNDPKEEFISDDTIDEELKEYDDDDDYEIEEEEIDDDDVVESSLINNTNISENAVDEFKLDSDAKSGKKLTNFKNDRFVEAYIGEDYKWVMKRPVNIYALLLSWIYFLYRKMYVIGIIGLIITGIVVRLFFPILIIYIAIVMILSGVLFNPIYKFVVDYRIKRIKEKNYGTDDFTLEQICQEKGGVNVIIPLIIFFIFLLIMFRTYYRIIINHENTKYWEENSQNKANCMSFVKNDFSLLGDNPETGTLMQAVCNISIVNSTKTYDVYIKFKEDNNYKYVYFKDEKDFVSIDRTSSLNKLQEKNRNNTITEEEKAELERLLQIKSNYNKFANKAEEEDRAIKENRNDNEKLNYIFTKDEILR